MQLQRYEKPGKVQKESISFSFYFQAEGLCRSLLPAINMCTDNNRLE